MKNFLGDTIKHQLLFLDNMNPTKNTSSNQTSKTKISDAIIKAAEPLIKHYKYANMYFAKWPSNVMIDGISALSDVPIDEFSDLFGPHTKRYEECDIYTETLEVNFVDALQSYLMVHMKPSKNPTRRPPVKAREMFDSKCWLIAKSLASKYKAGLLENDVLPRLNEDIRKLWEMWNHDYKATQKTYVTYP